MDLGQDSMDNQEVGQEGFQEVPLQDTRLLGPCLLMPEQDHLCHPIQTKIRDHHHQMEQSLPVQGLCTEIKIIRQYTIRTSLPRTLAVELGTTTTRGQGFRAQCSPITTITLPPINTNMVDNLQSDYLHLPWV